MAHKQHQAALSLLLEKAGVQGYLTTGDLMEVIPDSSTEHLRSLLAALRRHNVDVLDSEDDASDYPEADPISN